MFLANGIKAKLKKYNRENATSYYDDQTYEENLVRVIPYKVDDVIKLGFSTHPEATGFFQIDRRIDVKSGDQILFKGQIYTILKVQEVWLFNRVENKLLHVK